MRGERTALFVGCLLLFAPLAAEEQPSRELLEFLGSFETNKGQWIDPTRLPEPVPAAPAEKVGGAKEKSDERDE